MIKVIQVLEANRGLSIRIYESLEYTPPYIRHFQIMERDGVMEYQSPGAIEFCNKLEVARQTIGDDRFPQFETITTDMRGKKKVRVGTIRKLVPIEDELAKGLGDLVLQQTTQLAQVADENFKYGFEAGIGSWVKLFIKEPMHNEPEEGATCLVEVLTVNHPEYVVAVYRNTRFYNYYSEAEVDRINIYRYKLIKL